jgi:hypothetical protein
MTQGRQGQSWGPKKGEARWDSETSRGRVGRRLRKKGDGWRRKEWRKGKGSRVDVAHSRGKERDQGKGGGGGLR